MRRKAKLAILMGIMATMLITAGCTSSTEPPAETRVQPTTLRETATLTEQLPTRIQGQEKHEASPLIDQESEKGDEIPASIEVTTEATQDDIKQE